MPDPTISSLSATGTPPSAGNTTGAGAPGVAPTGSINDLFANLREMSWGGVSFPIAETELEVRQDLVIHKFADRNGAYVEGVGRHPVQITARIPFLNHLYGAKNETWAQGNLYPYQWRLFLKQCLEGTSKTLQHPELGPLNCKIDLARTTWAGTVRGGVWVHATWVESDDTQADQLGVDISKDSPIAQLVSNADDLDAQIATLESAKVRQKQVVQDVFQNDIPFSDLATAISGAIDTVTVLEKEFQGRTDNLIYQCNRVQTSLDLAENASPMNWPIFQNCERLKSSAWRLKQEPAITAPSNQVRKSITIAKDSTLGQVAAQVKTDIASFITLNAQFVGAPVVPAGSTLQYLTSIA